MATPPNNNMEHKTIKIFVPNLFHTSLYIHYLPLRLQIRRHYSIPDYLNHTEHKNPILIHRSYTAIRKTPVPYRPSYPHAHQIEQASCQVRYTDEETTFHYAVTLYPVIDSASPLLVLPLHTRYLSHPLTSCHTKLREERKTSQTPS